MKKKTTETMEIKKSVKTLAKKLVGYALGGILVAQGAGYIKSGLRMMDVI